MSAAHQASEEEAYWEAVRWDCLTREEQLAEGRERRGPRRRFSITQAIWMLAFSAVMLSPVAAGAWSILGKALR